MPAFYVMGYVGAAKRVRICLGWTHAVETMRAMGAAGVAGLVIQPIGRLMSEEM